MREGALLAALAAAFTPARAAASLARHPDAALAAEAARLARLPRGERLAALGDALAHQPRRSRTVAAAAAARERPALAAQLRAFPGETAGLHPLLRRLVYERGWDEEAPPRLAGGTLVRSPG